MSKITSVNELIGLLHQSRRLLNLLYEQYFTGRKLSQADCLQALSDDPSRLQTLLEVGILEVYPQGYSLHPNWMRFLREQLSGKVRDPKAVATIRGKIDQARQLLAMEVEPSLLDKRKEISLLLHEIHQKLLQQLDTVEEDKVFQDWDLLLNEWKQLVWTDLWAWWGIDDAWDIWLTDVWEEANEIERRIRQSTGVSLHPPILGKLEAIRRKREKAIPTLYSSLQQLLDESDAVFWESTPSKSSRISLHVFSGADAGSIAKKVKGRKKISLKPKPVQMVELMGTTSSTTQIEVEGLMQEFAASGKSLKKFIQEYSSTEKLPKDMQHHIYVRCLFQYGQVLEPIYVDQEQVFVYKER